jgi:DNA-binding Lrp family transcriptional regulator
MMLSLDERILLAVQNGLPICSRPYKAIADELLISEAQLLERLQALRQQGVIKRWGVIVKHRPLGYKANAMIVVNVPDERVVELGKKLSAEPVVNLCYQRPRQGERWPYNLYCMIHGKDRAMVETHWQRLQQQCGLGDFMSEILFSRRCFKQRGAWYPGGQSSHG